MTLSIRAASAWLGPGRSIENAQVVCDGGSITYAGPATPIGDADEELTVAGFLMPAVADRHVHIELSDPAAVVRGGVTAVRDLAWPPERIFALADASEMPSYRGPLVRAAGPMLTGHGGYPTKATWAPAGTGRELAGPEDGVRSVVADPGKSKRYHLVFQSRASGAARAVVALQAFDAQDVVLSTSRLDVAASEKFAPGSLALDLTAPCDHLVVTLAIRGAGSAWFDEVVLEGK